MYGTDIGVDRYWYSKWHRYECGIVCGTCAYKCSPRFGVFQQTS